MKSTYIIASLLLCLCMANCQSSWMIQSVQAQGNILSTCESLQLMTSQPDSETLVLTLIYDSEGSSNECPEAGTITLSLQSDVEGAKTYIEDISESETIDGQPVTGKYMCTVQGNELIFKEMMTYETPQRQPEKWREVDHPNRQYGEWEMIVTEWETIYNGDAEDYKQIIATLDDSEAVSSWDGTWKIAVAEFYGANSVSFDSENACPDAYMTTKTLNDGKLLVKAFNHGKNHQIKPSSACPGWDGFGFIAQFKGEVNGVASFGTQDMEFNGGEQDFYSSTIYNCTIISTQLTCNVVDGEIEEEMTWQGDSTYIANLISTEILYDPSVSIDYEDGGDNYAEMPEEYRF